MQMKLRVLEAEKGRGLFLMPAPLSARPKVSLSDEASAATKALGSSEIAVATASHWRARANHRFCFSPILHGLSPFRR